MSQLNIKYLATMALVAFLRTKDGMDNTLAMGLVYKNLWTSWNGRSPTTKKWFAYLLYKLHRSLVMPYKTSQFARKKYASSRKFSRELKSGVRF